MRPNLPNIITSCRIALAPVLVLVAWLGREHLFLVILICALVSDIVDGQIARRCNLATPLGAKLDSWADFLTSLTLPFGIYWLRPELIPSLWPAMLLAVVSYLLPIGIGFAKFRALTSYHTFLARVAAYVIGASTIVVFARGPVLPFQLSVVFLTLSGLEEIAITLILPRPLSNVGSFRKARELKRTLEASVH